MQDAKDVNPRKKNGPMPGPQVQRMQAFVVPVPMFMQLIELVRGNCSHRDAEPIMQQVGQLQPQEVTLTHD